jgi:hypothetical protein
MKQASQVVETKDHDQILIDFIKKQKIRIKKLKDKCKK